MKKRPSIDVTSYSEVAIPHLERILRAGSKVMEGIAERIVRDVKGGKSLLVFGSGHSGIFPLELYHRAGGASFVIPIVADYLLPTAGSAGSQAFGAHARDGQYAPQSH